MAWPLTCNGLCNAKVKMPAKHWYRSIRRRYLIPAIVRAVTGAP